MNWDEMEGEVHDLLDGRLDPAAEKRLRDRLKADPEAMRRFRELEALLAGLAQMRRERAPRGFSDRVLEEIRKTPSGSRGVIRTVRFPRGGWSVAAAVLLSGVAALLLWQFVDRRESTSAPEASRMASSRGMEERPDSIEAQTIEEQNEEDLEDPLRLLRSVAEEGRDAWEPPPAAPIGPRHPTPEGDRGVRDPSPDENRDRGDGSGKSDEVAEVERTRKARVGAAGAKGAPAPGARTEDGQSRPAGEFGPGEGSGSTRSDAGVRGESGKKKVGERADLPEDKSPPPAQATGSEIAREQGREDGKGEAGQPDRDELAPEGVGSDAYGPERIGQVLDSLVESLAGSNAPENEIKLAAAGAGGRDPSGASGEPDILVFRIAAGAADPDTTLRRAIESSLSARTGRSLPGGAPRVLAVDALEPEAGRGRPEWLALASLARRHPDRARIVEIGRDDVVGLLAALSEIGRTRVLLPVRGNGSRGGESGARDDAISPEALKRTSARDSKEKDLGVRPAADPPFRWTDARDFAAAPRDPAVGFLSGTGAANRTGEEAAAEKDEAAGGRVRVVVFFETGGS